MLRFNVASGRLSAGIQLDVVDRLTPLPCTIMPSIARTGFRRCFYVKCKCDPVSGRSPRGTTKPQLGWFSWIALSSLSEFFSVVVVILSLS